MASTTFYCIIFGLKEKQIDIKDKLRQIQEMRKKAFPMEHVQ